MKTYVIALLISWLARQTPDGFYYLLKGKQIEMTTFGSTGKRISPGRSFISDARQRPCRPDLAFERRFSVRVDRQRQADPRAFREL